MNQSEYLAKIEEVHRKDTEDFLRLYSQHRFPHSAEVFTMIRQGHLIRRSRRLGERADYHARNPWPLPPAGTKCNILDDPEAEADLEKSISTYAGQDHLTWDIGNYYPETTYRIYELVSEPKILTCEKWERDLTMPSSESSETLDR